MPGRNRLLREIIMSEAVMFDQINDINPEILLAQFVDAGRITSKERHENLDWPQVLEAVATRCRSPETRDLMRNIPQLDETSLAARRLTEVRQLMEIYDAGDHVVSVSVESVDEILVRAARGVALPGEDLLKVAGNLSTFQAVRRFYEARKEEAPLLWMYAEDIEVLPTLEKRIHASFDADGKLVDEASPELARLRERSRRLAESLRSRIENKLSAPDVQPLLQDSYYTLREGRYVLPVKAAERAHVAGIVHATSASGQTVFIEPAELVELNNALRISDFGIEAEELRILQTLSGEVGAHRETIVAGVRRCLYLDGVDAVARFAIDTRCHIPDLSRDTIELYQARHPLLALRQFEHPDQCVVPNDIMLYPPSRCFVISGANAGGKTVNLKTVGLFALMIKAGMPITAGASSSFPVFGRVFADIGDDQSINQNISTFSAHVQSLSNALTYAENNTLFLLDEPFSGTDPEHAAPLVLSLLTYLYQHGATSFATTHFENVKAFALETSWVASGSVSFDMQWMKPTYRLRIGHPGTSAAFEIAQQHGLPDEILQAARERYDAKSTSRLEHVIESIEEQRIRLEEARALVAQSQAELDRERAQVAELREKMRAQVAESLGADVEKALENVKRIKARLNKLRRKTFEPKLRSANDEQQEIERELNALSDEARLQKSAVNDMTAPPFNPMPEREIIIGKKVYLRPYRKNATVCARSGNQLTLQLGILQVRAQTRDVGYPITDDVAEPTAKEKRIKNAKIIDVPVENARLLDETTMRPIMAQLSSNTLDLRGLTAEDAIERTEFFLQSLQVRDEPMGYIIHGHGTGVLKNTVRHFLSKSPLVDTSRPGQYYEGGDGVTLAWIKS